MSAAAAAILDGMPDARDLHRLDSGAAVMLTGQNLGHLSLMAGRHGEDGWDAKLAPTVGTLLARAVRRDQRLPLGPFLIAEAFLVFLLAVL
jgi:hypothetical protein